MVYVAVLSLIGCIIIGFVYGWKLTLVTVFVAMPVIVSVTRLYKTLQTTLVHLLPIHRLNILLSLSPLHDPNADLNTFRCLLVSSGSDTKFSSRP